MVIVVCAEGSVIAQRAGRRHDRGQADDDRQSALHFLTAFWDQAAAWEENLELSSSERQALSRAGGRERILGAHVVGPHAEEVINVFALAIRRRLTVDDVKDAFFAYPTAGSDIPYML